MRKMELIQLSPVMWYVQILLRMEMLGKETFPLPNEADYQTATAI